jgi:hypothetical protein
LLKKQKTEKSLDLKNSIKHLNREIKNFYHISRVRNVRKHIVPGSSQSLWRTVKASKDINAERLPNAMFENDAQIDPDELANRFADFFDGKVKSVTSNATIDDNVYNGTRIVFSENKFFVSILTCIKSMKLKNSEGYDCILQCILIDGSDILILPLTNLFQRMYDQRSVPQQWLLAKTIHVFKSKGNLKDIEIIAL